MTALTAVQPRAQHTLARAGSGSEPAAGVDFGAVLAAACCGSAPPRDASPADAPTADGPPADGAPTDETAAPLVAAAPAGPVVPVVPGASPAAVTPDAGTSGAPAAVPVVTPATAQAAPESATAEVADVPAAPAPAPTAAPQPPPSAVTAPPLQPAPVAEPVAEPVPTPGPVATPAPTQPTGTGAPQADAVEPSPTEDASVAVEPELLPPSASAAPAPAQAQGPASAAAVDVVASGATAAGAPAPTSAVEVTAPAPAPAPPPPAAAQVLTAVGPVLEGPDGSYSMSLQLYPEELGAVQVEISLRNGELTLALHAADKDAVEVLRSAVSELRAQLESTGVRSTDVTVDLGQGNRREHEEQQTARRTRPGDAAEAAPADEPTTTPSDRESAVDVRI